DSKSTIARAHCKHCDRTHYGGGDNCWYTFPEKATQEWRDKNADYIKTKKGGANAAAVKDNSYFQPHNGLMFFTARTTPVVDISNTVRELAGRGEYQNRLILDTGATDHLCNDHSKFTSFDRGSYYAVINTGAGPITITQKGTIKVTVLRSDGTSEQVSFSNV
ncbi:hypothetical protein BU25DRAFT_307414, partial [Macroventuria anomochaeta]